MKPALKVFLYLLVFVFTPLSAAAFSPLYAAGCSAGSCSEDFSTESYKDATSTIANWNTTQGVLKLSGSEQPTGEYFRQATMETVTNPSSGNTFVVWQGASSSTNKFSVLAQKLDSNGNRLWSKPVKVNEVDFTVSAIFPRLDVDRSRDEIVVAWQDWRDDPFYYEVYAQRLDTNGNKLWGSGIRVNTDPLRTRNHSFPVVAIESSGQALIAWEDNRLAACSVGTNAQIFGQKLERNGSRLWGLTDRNLVRRNVCNRAEFALSWNALSNSFVTVYQDRSYQIYLQRIDGNGAPLWASDLFLGEDYEYPELSTDTSGTSYIVFSWDSGVYYQKVTSSGVKLATPKKINLNSSWTFYWLPHIDCLGDGTCSVIWLVRPPGGSINYKTYGQRLDSSGNDLWANDVLVSPNVSQFRANDDGVGVESSGRIMVSFVDGWTMQIWSRKFDTLGNVDSTWEKDSPVPGTVPILGVWTSNPGTVFVYSPTTQVAQSLAYDTLSTNLNYTSFSKSETLNGGTISYSFSTSDDGSTNWSNWFSDIASLPDRRFLKWRTTLNTPDSSRTPLLDSLNINYQAITNQAPNLPTLVGPPDSTWLNYNPTYEADVSDPNSGDTVWAFFDFVAGPIDGNGSLGVTPKRSAYTPTTPDGQYQWRAKGVDNQGAESGYTASRQVFKDTGRPTPTIDQENGISNDTAISVTLTESDTLSGVAEGDVDLSVNAGPWQNYASRIADFTYTGSCNDTYLFRYRVRDNANNWSGFVQDAGGSVRVNCQPTVPTSLLTNNQVNPTGLTGTPFFSAIYNDPDTSDTANMYQIQVDNNSNFSSPYWDSGNTSMSNCSRGNRCQDISYGGSSLAPGVRYYSQIMYKDVGGLWSLWSTEVAYFELQAYGDLVGYVWNDLYANCLRDGSEENKSGVDVAISGPSGNFSLRTDNRADFNYTFSGLLPGDYTVEVTIPSGWRSTTETRQTVTVTGGLTTQVTPRCL